MTRLEKDLEAEVVDYVEQELGGLCLKLKLEGRRGWPDRMVLLPDGVMLFLEFKRNRKADRRAQQEQWLRRLQELGFVAEFCWFFGDAVSSIERARKCQ